MRVSFSIDLDTSESWDLEKIPLITEFLNKFDSRPKNIPEQKPMVNPMSDDPWPTVTDGVLVDVDGFPWDERINSENKVCTSAGRWRKKRGVTDKEYKKVRNELKGATPAPAPAPEEPTSAPPPPPAPDPEEPTSAPPPPPDPDPEDTGPAELSFPSFMEWVGKQNPKYTGADGLNELCAKVGLESIAFLAVKPQYIPKLVELVQNEKQGA